MHVKMFMNIVCYRNVKLRPTSVAMLVILFALAMKETLDEINSKVT